MHPRTEPEWESHFIPAPSLATLEGSKVRCSARRKSDEKAWRCLPEVQSPKYLTFHQQGRHVHTTNHNSTVTSCSWRQRRQPPSQPHLRGLNQPVTSVKRLWSRPSNHLLAFLVLLFSPTANQYSFSPPLAAGNHIRPEASRQTSF